VGGYPVTYVSACMNANDWPTPDMCDWHMAKTADLHSGDKASDTA